MKVVIIQDPAHTKVRIAATRIVSCSWPWEFQSL